MTGILGNLAATPLTVGNSAKLYCLNWIDRYLQERQGTVRILDLGCGTANNFGELMRHYGRISYTGIEPSRTACAQARINLQGLDATIIEGYAYSAKAQVPQPFDLVISFSVLEHVYQRRAYLQAAKDCLSPGGYLLINYDAGHFVVGSRRDRVKNVVGPILARFGNERYYQSFVHEQDFLGMVHDVDLTIVEALSFNTALKGVYKKIPEAHRGVYMEKWLEFELWLNQIGLTYTDSQATTFTTRNFILQRPGQTQLNHTDKG